MSKLADLLKNSDFIFNAKQCFVLNFSHVTSVVFCLQVIITCLC